MIVAGTWLHLNHNQTLSTSSVVSGVFNPPASTQTIERPSTAVNVASSRFLDAEQAAAFLGGLNSRTVTRWAREGYLPAYPIGEGKRRLWRFLASDLEQWMLSRRTGTGSDTLASAVDAPTRGFIQ